MLNDLSELLFDAITLLVNEKNDKDKIYIDMLLTIVLDEDKKSSYIKDIELLKILTNMTREVLKLEDATDEVERAKILTKFITNPILTKQPIIQKAVETIFSGQTKTKLSNIRTRIKNNIRYCKFTQLNKNIYTGLTTSGDTNDELKQSNILDNVQTSIKVFSEDESRILSGTDSSILERIDMTDIAALTDAVDRFKVSEVFGILKTPLQGMNQLCGERGGIALGESWNISALTHMGKSAFLRLMADGMTRFNLPSLEIAKIKKGIPLLLFISLENEANKNVVLWYKSIYAEQYGEFPKIVKETNSIEVAKYIADFYSKFAYKLIIERRLGTSFGFDEYAQLIEEYEALGYRVDAVFIDYMNQMKMISQTNAHGGADYVLLRNLYNNMCNYNRTKIIAQISAHQLNREAAQIANSGKRNIVKAFGGHLLANGIDVQREVDLETYIHLEYNQYNQRFLTCSRGKHRYVDNTPKTDQYFAYPFMQYGECFGKNDPRCTGILIDIDKKPGFVRDIYGVEAPAGYAAENEECQDGTSMF